MYSIKYNVHIRLITNWYVFLTNIGQQWKNEAQRNSLYRPLLAADIDCPGTTISQCHICLITNRLSPCMQNTHTVVSAQLTHRHVPCAVTCRKRVDMVIWEFFSVSEKDCENVCNSKLKHLTQPHSLQTDIFKKLTEGKRLKLKLSRAQSLGMSNRSKQIKEKKTADSKK